MALADLLSAECSVLGTIKGVAYLVLLIPPILSPKHNIHSVLIHVSILRHIIHSACAS